MTAREYAKSVDFEIVGKLTKKSYTSEVWDWKKGEEVEERFVYYVDEAGNEFNKYPGGGWSITTADGGVI